MGAMMSRELHEKIDKALDKLIDLKIGQRELSIQMERREQDTNKAVDKLIMPLKSIQRNQDSPTSDSSQVLNNPRESKRN